MHTIRDTLTCPKYINTPPTTYANERTATVAKQLSI